MMNGDPVPFTGDTAFRHQPGEHGASLDKAHEAAAAAEGIGAQRAHGSWLIHEPSASGLNEQ